MSIFSKAIAWLAKAFVNIKHSAAPIAVAITAGINEALNSGFIDMTAKGVEAMFPNVQHLPEVIVADLKIGVPKVLALELGIEVLSDTPTQEELQTFSKKVLDAFNVHDDKSKLYTTLGAQIYGILLRHVGQGPVTFAQRVKDIEEAYQDYLADMAANNM